MPNVQNLCAANIFEESRSVNNKQCYSFIIPKPKTQYILIVENLSRNPVGMMSALHCWSTTRVFGVRFMV